jgi:nucleoside-diphosphate-sugar epimerase
MNVLVTGASGFVGADLTKKLLDEGYTVFAVVRSQKKLARTLPSSYLDRVTVLEGDLLVDADLTKLQHQLQDMTGNLDMVLDLAGGGPLTANNKVQSFNTNFKTTSNLIQILENSKKLSSITLFVYYSSLAAMGLPGVAGDRILYNENTVCNPVLPLERGKLESESFLKELASKYGFKTVVLRFPQIYGLADAAFMQIVSLIRKGVFPVVRGKIGSLPLINLRDVVGATYAVVRNANSIQGNFNVHLVCEGSYSYNYLVELVKKKYGQGGVLRIPFWFMYLGVWMVEVVFGLLQKPEPLNRRRLVSLTKDRIVDSSKFVNSFNFKFEENVERFITGELS